jgi:hypothetical protein
MIRNLILTIISLIVLSCAEVQERNINVSLSFDEVLLPIPDDLTNDWYGASFSVENDQIILHIYDPYQKNIAQYSINEKKVINRLRPFSDTLNPGNNLVRLKKINSGYFASSIFGFLHLDNTGKLLSKYDVYFPQNNRIENWDYSSKLRLSASRNALLSSSSPTTTPLAIELANVFKEAVFREDFYDFDILSNFDFTTGELTTFPIRFPDNFKQNGKSYPTNFKFSFTGLDNGRIAYSFGIDENIHILDVAKGKVETHLVSNPNLPIIIYPIDEISYRDKSFYSDEYLSNYTIYSNLYHHPDMEILLRMALKVENGVISTIFELINSNWDIIGEFELPENYFGIPVFFPNEIWFPFRFGYKPDEMKYYKVTIGE